MEIFPNPAFAALMTLPFVVTFIALHFIIFRPIFDYLQDRDSASTGAKVEAESLRVDIAEQSTRVAKRLDTARTEVARARAARRAKALEREGEILHDARAEADATVADALEALQAARETASAELRSTAGVLSQDIAEQVLGRAVS